MRLARTLVFALGLTALGGCDVSLLSGASPGMTPVEQGPATERAVEQAAQRYGSLLLAMDAAGVANMYTPEGVWERASGPLTGRDAIRNALANPNGVTVLGVEMKTSYIAYNGPAVVQTGDISQTVKLPNGRTTTSSARFEATWVRTQEADWRILRMVTRPNTAKPAGS
jgi:uncharacterized protein (TIGR02246 family)